MLAAFGSPSGERVAIYVEAVREEQACERCAARAARDLAHGSKRRPTPRDLLDAARELMASAEHVRHAQRPSLPGGTGSAWLASEGRAIVLEVWPQISAEDLDLVMRELQRQVNCGVLDPSRRGLVECLGWEDELGPTTERRWWLRTLRMRARQRGAA
jgi:hypothetical protein